MTNYRNPNNRSLFETVQYSNHEPKLNMAANGLLQSVTYPTGGHLGYVYTQNEVSYHGRNIYSGGVSVSSTNLTTDEPNNQDIYTSYQYQTSSGASTRWGYEDPVYFSLSSNIYRLESFHKGERNPGTEYPQAAASIDMGKIWGKAIINALISAGIQIVIGEILTTAGLASYIPYLNWVVLAYAVIKIVVVMARVDRNYTYTYILSNQNAINRNPIGGRYSSVQVRILGPGYTNNGKTVYSFTDNNDYPLIRPTIDWPYTKAPREVPWVYGLPKSVIVYDKNNKIVKESYNLYNLKDKNTIANSVTTDNFNCNCESRRMKSIRWSNWDSKNYFILWEDNELLPRPYYNITGRVDQMGTYEKQYNTKGELVYEDKTSIVTDPRTLLLGVKTTRKDPNSTISQRTFYPLDYNISGTAGEALNLLKSRNAIHTPVSTETWETKTELTYGADGGLVTDGNGNPTLLQTKNYLIDASATEFKKYIIGGVEQVKPWKIYTLKTNAPIPDIVMGKQDPSMLLRHPEFYKLQTEMIYDAQGNLVETISDGNNTSFINDYYDRYVIASVANADYKDIAYTSFESNGQGNWTFPFNPVSGNTYITTNDYVTGVRSYQLSGNNSIYHSGLGIIGAHKKYTVTYWAKTATASSITVNGQSAVELYATADGWSLYSTEIDIYNTTNGAVTISGRSLIDEVRLYPTGALMSTVAYQQGIGKITECDANNRLMFYEYDGLGRLKLIKDQNKNIIKTYEYNYKH